MPELPEVETTRRGILPHLLAQKVQQLVVRQRRLRWEIPLQLETQLQHAVINDVQRRGKYLLVITSKGTVIIHLGMSGSLRILTTAVAAGKHDHVDMVLSNGTILRFNDPRRFGAWLWTVEDPLNHLLLKTLGPEPLSDELSGDYLFKLAKRRKTTIKQFMMDSHVVVGVGNIYAAEVLFLSKLHPLTSIADISLKKFDVLVGNIRKVLSHAIEVGGTTIRNFSGSDGKPGYFKQQLWVYGRAGEKCKKCKNVLEELKIAQRASVFCAHCQKIS